MPPSRPNDAPTEKLDFTSNTEKSRYLEMVDHALKGDRLIGLIQPQDTSEESPQGEVPVQKIG